MFCVNVICVISDYLRKNSEARFLVGGDGKMPAIQLRKGMTKEVYSKELSKLIGASVKVGDVFHMETKNGNVYLYFFGDYNGDYNGDKFSFLPLKELRRINSEDYIAALRASEKLG